MFFFLILWDILRLEITRDNLRSDGENTEKLQKMLERPIVEKECFGNFLKFFIDISKLVEVLR